MTKNNLLGVEIQESSQEEVLEKIKKYIQTQRSKDKRQEEFLHVVSLNPEIMVELDKNLKFKKAVTAAQIRIVDGIGVWFGAQVMGIRHVKRIQGVDLADRLLHMAEAERLEGLFIGGKGDLADYTAKCYKQKLKNLKLTGFEGIKNIKSVKPEEEERIFSIVARHKPHFVMVAFGSPFQELWLESHKDKFKGMVCMGVGGSFDFLSGKVRRAPRIIRRLGLEWLFRLIVQPWRIKRQLKLIKFIELVFRQKAGLL